MHIHPWTFNLMHTDTLHAAVEVIDFLQWMNTDGHLQSLDWASGLDTKNHFYASNEIHMPIGLHDAPQNSLLAQD